MYNKYQPKWISSATDKVSPLISEVKKKRLFSSVLDALAKFFSESGSLTYYTNAKAACGTVFYREGIPLFTLYSIVGKYMNLSKLIGVIHDVEFNEHADVQIYYHKHSRIHTIDGILESL